VISNADNCFIWMIVHIFLLLAIFTEVLFAKFFAIRIQTHKLCFVFNLSITKHTFRKLCKLFLSCYNRFHHLFHLLNNNGNYIINYKSPFNNLHLCSEIVHLCCLYLNIYDSNILNYY